MEFARLGASGPEVPRLGVGGCPFGGHGWGPVDCRSMVRAVHAALDLGLNFFDTADVYGLGQSEMLLGEALRGRSAVIATKCGVRVEGGRTFYDNSPRWITAACEGSLRRLGRDCIDLYQLHYRDGRPMEEILETFQKLRDSGKIRQFGLSNLSISDLPEMMPFAGEFASVQNEYSLARRQGEGDLMEICGHLDASPMTWGSLGQGVLTGKYTASTAFGSDDRRSRETYVNFRPGTLERNLQIVEILRRIGLEREKSPAAVAVRFILDKLPGSVALCGVKGPEQLLPDALGWHLTSEELALLDAASANESPGHPGLSGKI